MFVFILYMITVFGDSGYHMQGIKVYGNNGIDVQHACEAVGRSKLTFEKEEGYTGFYCEAQKKPKSGAKG